MQIFYKDITESSEVKTYITETSATLEDFLKQNISSSFCKPITINGKHPVDGKNQRLEPYNVIEVTKTGTVINLAEKDEEEESEKVKVFISDYTGRSEEIELDCDADQSISEMYINDVKYSVFRENKEVYTSFLKDGDRVFVTLEGGIKGGQ